MTITFTYAGDSITAQPTSWLNHLDEPELENLGGTAISGATSTDVLARVKPVAADVLVLMLGTNDVRLGLTTAETRSNLAKITAKVGAPRVLLCATPPSDITDYGADHIDRQVGGFALNRDGLSDLAGGRGWLYADPWAPFRRYSNGWAPGAAMADGVHPTESTSTKAAPRIATYIRQALAGATLIA